MSRREITCVQWPGDQEAKRYHEDFHMSDHFLFVKQGQRWKKEICNWQTSSFDSCSLRIRHVLCMTQRFQTTTRAFSSPRNNGMCETLAAFSCPDSGSVLGSVSKVHWISMHLHTERYTVMSLCGLADGKVNLSAQVAESKSRGVAFDWDTYLGLIAC